MKRMSAPIQIPQDSVSRWTAQTVGMDWEILDRMERAVAKVRERLLRATAALNQAGVPYAVVGGNAVASWVATINDRRPADRSIVASQAAAGIGEPIEADPGHA